MTINIAARTPAARLTAQVTAAVPTAMGNGRQTVNAGTPIPRGCQQARHRNLA
jgi:hypothetical protein